MAEIPPEVRAKMDALTKSVDNNRTDTVLKTENEGATRGTNQPKLDADWQRAGQTPQPTPAPTPNPGPDKS